MPQEDRRPDWVMPFWLSTISILCFGLLALAASRTRNVPGDGWILEQIQRIPDPPAKLVADLGNLLGVTVATPIVLVTLAVFAAHRGSPQTGLFCLVLGLLRLAARALKPLVDSQRPTIQDGIIRAQFDGSGYPSGHTLTATVIAGATTIVMLKVLPDWRFTRLVIGLVWFWMAACGFARIWYGAHWPSDVLGGFLAGLVLIGISTIAANRIRLPSRQSAFDPQQLHGN